MDAKGQDLNPHFCLSTLPHVYCKKPKFINIPWVKKTPQKFEKQNLVLNGKIKFQLNIEFPQLCSAKALSTSPSKCRCCRHEPCSCLSSAVTWVWKDKQKPLPKQAGPSTMDSGGQWCRQWTWAVWVVSTCPLPLTGPAMRQLMVAGEEGGTQYRLGGCLRSKLTMTCKIHSSSLQQNQPQLWSVSHQYTKKPGSCLQHLLAVWLCASVFSFLSWKQNQNQPLHSYHHLQTPDVLSCLCRTVVTIK